MEVTLSLPLDKFVSPKTHSRNRLREQQFEDRRTRKITELVQTGDPVVVFDYNATAQTVDIVLKSNPDMLPIRGVPVMGAAPPFRIITAFKTIANGDAEPTIGWVAFPRSDCRGLLDDHETGEPYTRLKHRPICPVFFPGLPVTQDPAPPRVGVDIAEGDSALVHESGSAIIFKENGDVVISAQGKVYVAGSGNTTGNAAARQGDAGDGPGGAISGGSSDVFIG